MYVRLILGNYYSFDSSCEESAKVIMADQLCGLWYLRACDINEPVSGVAILVLFFGGGVD